MSKWASLFLFLVVLRSTHAQEHTYKIYYNTYNETGDSLMLREFSGNTETYNHLGEKIESTETWEYKEKKHVLNFNYRNESGWSSYFLHPDREHFTRTVSNCAENVYYKTLDADTTILRYIRCDEDGEWVYAKCLKGCEYEDSLIIKDGAHYWQSIYKDGDTMTSFNRFDHLKRSVRFLQFISEPADSVHAFHFFYDDVNKTRFHRNKPFASDTIFEFLHYWDYFDENWNPVRSEEWGITSAGDSMLVHKTEYVRLNNSNYDVPCKLYVNNSCHNHKVVGGRKNLINIDLDGHMDEVQYVDAKHGEIIQENGAYYIIPDKSKKCEVEVGYYREDGFKTPLYSRTFSIVKLEDY